MTTCWIWGPYQVKPRVGIPLARSDEVCQKKSYYSKKQTCCRRFWSCEKHLPGRGGSSSFNGKDPSRTDYKLGPNRIHPVPASTWMMDREWSKRVEISGAIDKRQITAVFCGSLTGDFLPLQLIYKDKTTRCHPQFQFPLDWHVTHSPKHWWTEQAMLEYITEIIVPLLRWCENLWEIRSRLH